jgi:hypothetical protein
MPKRVGIEIGVQTETQLDAQVGISRLIYKHNARCMPLPNKMQWLRNLLFSVRAVSGMLYIRLQICTSCLTVIEARVSHLSLITVTANSSTWHKNPYCLYLNLNLPFSSPLL